MTDEGSRVAAAQIVGAREGQEDALSFRRLKGASPLALVVADGMGGHSGGHVASDIAVKSFLDRMESEGGSPTALKPALMAANAAIAQAVEKDSKLEGMGTTLIGVLVAGDHLSWISVGDSSLFLIRNGEALKLNADHSMRPVLADLVSTGRISEDDAARDTNRNALRSAVSGDEISLIDQSRSEHLMREGDIVLLCSDGIDTLAGDEIAKRAQEAAPNAQAIADSLISGVSDQARPRQDNASVIAYVHASSVAQTSAATASPFAWRRRLWIAATAAGLITAIAGALVFAPKLSPARKTTAPQTTAAGKAAPAKQVAPVNKPATAPAQPSTAKPVQK